MGASKLVILKGGQGLRYGRSLPTPFHGYSEEGTGENKQRRKGMRQIFTGELN